MFLHLCYAPIDTRSSSKVHLSLSPSKTTFSPTLFVQIFHPLIIDISYENRQFLAASVTDLKGVDRKGLTEERTSLKVCRGAVRVGALGVRAPPPAFHTLAKDMFLNRCPTHFTLGLRPCIISSFLIWIYPYQNYPDAPLNVCNRDALQPKRIFFFLKNKSRSSLQCRISLQPLCFLSEYFKIIRTLAFLCFPSVSVWVHTPGR